MITYICYEKTPAGKIQLMDQEHKTKLANTLAVNAQGNGIYDVQGEGGFPEKGQFLLLPVKGALSTSLKLLVLSVEPLITPAGAWQARCQGPDVNEFSLRRLDVCCDRCHVSSQMEFVQFSDDQRQDAIEAMSGQGWQANIHEQVCPSCLKGGMKKVSKINGNV
jgi:hypothetical protein